MAHPAVPLSHPPTIADIDALPRSTKGEILDGVFYAMTRPRGFHQSVVGRIHFDAAGPYERGRGGPGGWWILPDPGIEFSDSPEVSPDLAGWRRERMPTVPSNEAIVVVPDWVCEVLSDSSRRYNLRTKKPFYARKGVGYLWLVDPAERLLTAQRLENGSWVELGVWGDETDARVPPFEGAEIDLSGWWLGADP